MGIDNTHVFNVSIFAIFSNSNQPNLTCYIMQIFFRWQSTTMPNTVGYNPYSTAY
ncbi:hypothetical protein [Moraxella lacunata]|uniref:hypothetical protein n=1 Tax=Moraxella lacunata TaxID=477 RepID=UPI003EE10375